MQNGRSTTEPHAQRSCKWSGWVSDCAIGWNTLRRNPGKCVTLCVCSACVEQKFVHTHTLVDAHPPVPPAGSVVNLRVGRRLRTTKLVCERRPRLWARAVPRGDPMKGHSSVSCTIPPKCSVPLGERLNTWDNVAEWSKAPDLGSGPYGRGFEPHRCHLSNGNDAACEWYPILAALTVGIFLFSVQPTQIHSKVMSVHCSLYKGSQRVLTDVTTLSCSELAFG